MNIAWVGLGKLGLPCAEVIAKKGHSVSGYDINYIKSLHVTMYPTLKGAVQSADIVFVAVPTPHDPAYDGAQPTSHLEPKDFDYSAVKEALIECNKVMTKDQLLVLVSTVLPGTTRNQFVPLITNTRFAYNPYLIAMGTVASDMVNPEMVMIGAEPNDAEYLKSFYETIMENFPRYVLGTWDECECIKVFYNTFISTKIALVNMIQDVAVKQGNINVNRVTDALAHSTQRIMSPNYMTAGMGDGGACHPRDNIALRYLADRLNLGYDIFDSIMTAREKQAENMAIEILKHGNKIKFSSNSYKPNVDYTDGSYSLLVQHYVKKHGGWIVNDNPSVFVLVHPGDEPMENVYNFDPWNDYGVKYETNT